MSKLSRDLYSGSRDTTTLSRSDADYPVSADLEMYSLLFCLLNF